MQVAQQFATFFFHKGRQKGLFKKNKAKRVQATNVTRSTLMGRHHGGFGAGLGPLATTQGEGRPPRGHAVVRSFSQGRRRRSRLVLRRRRAPGDAGQVACGKQNGFLINFQESECQRTDLKCFSVC